MSYAVSCVQSHVLCNNNFLFVEEMMGSLPSKKKSKETPAPATTTTVEVTTDTSSDDLPEGYYLPFTPQPSKEPTQAQSKIKTYLAGSPTETGLEWDRLVMLAIAEIHKRGYFCDYSSGMSPS